MTDTCLYLVRHGETEENVARLLQGHLPGHLTARGREQAEALCQQLRHCKFDAFFSSDLQRAVDTARILAPAVGLPLQRTPMLRERDWGSLTGQAIESLRGTDFPPDVESIEAFFARAHRVLAFFRNSYAGQNVLAVTHGLFARCLCAAHNGTSIADVPRMGNATLTTLNL